MLGFDALQAAIDTALELLNKELLGAAKSVYVNKEKNPVWHATTYKNGTRAGRYTTLVVSPKEYATAVRLVGELEDLKSIIDKQIQEMQTTPPDVLEHHLLGCEINFLRLMFHAYYQSRFGTKLFLTSHNDLARGFTEQYATYARQLHLTRNPFSTSPQGKMLLHTREGIEATAAGPSRVNSDKASVRRELVFTSDSESEDLSGEIREAEERPEVSEASSDEMSEAEGSEASGSVDYEARSSRFEQYKEAHQREAALEYTYGKNVPDEIFWETEAPDYTDIDPNELLEKDCPPETLLMSSSAEFIRRWDATARKRLGQQFDAREIQVLHTFFSKDTARRFGKFKSLDIEQRWVYQLLPQPLLYYFGFNNENWERELQGRYQDYLSLKLSPEKVARFLDQAFQLFLKRSAQFGPKMVRNGLSVVKHRSLFSDPRYSIGQLVCSDKIIGVGTYSTVYAGTMSIEGKPQPVSVAVKLFQNDSTSLSLNSSLLPIAECQLLRQLQSPYVVELYMGMTDLMRPFSVMPQYPFSLEDYLDKHSETLSNETLWEMMKQTSECLSFLHGRNVVYRDLKTSNILVEMLDGGFRLRMCDFNIAIMHPNRDAALQGRAIDTFTGTRVCAAPELLSAEGLTSHTLHSDVYALGVTLWAIEKRTSLLEENVYPDLVHRCVKRCRHSSSDTEDQITSDNLRHAVGQGRRPETRGISHELVTLLMQCWSHEPHQRPDAKGVVSSLVDIRSRYVGVAETAAAKGGVEPPTTHLIDLAFLK